MSPPIHELRRRARLLVDAFALPSKGVPRLTHVARGAVGTVDRLDTGVDSYAVKSFFWVVDELVVAREVAFRDALERAGVRSPANIATPDGRYLVHLSQETDLPNVRLYEWFDGHQLSNRDADSAIRLLARLHQTPVPTEDSPDPWYELVPDENRWQALALRASRAQAAWADLLGASLHKIGSLRAMIRSSRAAERRMCHLDVQPSNMLVSGDEIVLLDWDNAGPGVPARELAAFLADWAGTEPAADGALVSRLMHAYRDAGGPATIRSIDDFSMHIATRLNFIFVQAELALDVAADDGHRVNANRWTASGLNALPDASRLGQILEIARRGNT